jgi:hypothetical protein
MKSKFSLKKDRILTQLALPDSTYKDLSPKGKVDEGIKAIPPRTVVK